MTSAMQALQDLQQRFARRDSVPTAEVDQCIYWAGTALGMAGVPLLVGEGELDEIIETPAVTPIPGTRPWAMGLATHRGGLIPVISGDVLLRREPYTGRLRDHCMVIRRPGMHFAITLSDVKRSIRFPLDDRDMNREVDPVLEGFTLGGFVLDDVFYPVLDLEKLITDGELADAAMVPETSNEELRDE
jgi:twitching motility protein PilI